ncbi:MAG: hypothetical protein RLZ44_972 [Pseudomonadota bacterium]|jgi:type IV pilus assembly protein PilX
MSVVFLLLLSMLGVWAMSGNVLQERMAGNLRSRDLAQQAAEATARYVESKLSEWTTNNWYGEAFDGSTGLSNYDASTPNDRNRWLNAATWANARTLPAGTLPDVAERPKYLVERMALTENPVSGLTDIQNYRITIRAVGRDPNAVVILQVVLRYTP